MRPVLKFSRCLAPLVAIALTAMASVAAGNTPPIAPLITEPVFDGVVVSPADAHMETAPFSDPDPGDTHAGSDWEIWRVSPLERVWSVTGATGLEALHVHLADGAFEGSHDGRTSLLPETDYQLRVRHRDNSGNAASEWSGWSVRSFRAAALVPPMPGAGWAIRQPGYRVEIVATNFQLPVNIAFVPNAGSHPNDPFFYVTELYGAIKVVLRGGEVRDYATNLLNFNPTGLFPGSGEQGLTGIAVDPASGDVFAAMLYEDTASTNSTKPHYPKVVRFSSADGGLTAATQTTILDMFGESQGQSHQISNVTIGPDGRLYVHMGDGFTTATAQDLNSFRGKILRLNLDGSAPTDNPFHNAVDGITARDYVFSYGHRNPFGGAWRSADGFHYVVENGSAVDRFARVVAGRNYGWNGFDSSMSTFALHTWSPATAPVNVVFVEPGTFDGSGYPAGKQGRAFVTESGSTYATGPSSRGKRITEFELDANGNRVSGPTILAEYTGSGKSTAIALAAGPDGLYFTDFYKDLDAATPIERGANVLRIRHIGTPPPGEGDGLRGEYFNTTNFTALAATRIDPEVNFDWAAGPPSAGMNTNNFSVRWTGQVQPHFTETHTFHTVTDDGVRLWVNGQILVDKWQGQGATEWTGSIGLQAHRRYDIRMEYYDGTGNASAKLFWSGPSIAKSVIPQSQLYSAPAPNRPFRFDRIERPPGGASQLELSGNPGQVHLVEASTNLAHWTLLAAVTNRLGPAAVTDPSTNFAQRFYRMSAAAEPPTPEIVIDTPALSLTGTWSSGTSASDRFGVDYRFKSGGSGSAWAQFTPNIQKAGNYKIYAWYPQGSNRSTNAPYVITHGAGTTTIRVNQQANGGRWNLLGAFPFAGGTNGHVRLTDDIPDPSRLVMADAVRFVCEP